MLLCLYGESALCVNNTLRMSAHKNSLELSSVAIGVILMASIVHHTNGSHRAAGLEETRCKIIAS